VKQHRQLARWPLAVLLGEPQHRILHDIERRLLLADGVHGLLESAPLDALEKRR
jgi:hypothetical protein